MSSRGTKPSQASAASTDSHSPLLVAACYGPTSKARGITRRRTEPRPEEAERTLRDRLRAKGSGSRLRDRNEVVIVEGGCPQLRPQRPFRDGEQ